MKINIKSIGINKIYFDVDNKKISKRFADFNYFILSIAWAVCDSSAAIVIGPTPPGTGV